MPAPDAILPLIDRFSQQIDSYHAAKYNETQTRCAASVKILAAAPD